MFCFWNSVADKMEPMFSNNSFRPKATSIENSGFYKLGRGNWASCRANTIEGAAWSKNVWELVSSAWLKEEHGTAAANVTGKSEKAYTGDPVSRSTQIQRASSSELNDVLETSHDLVITDPPFGGILQYAELSDFFYVWLRLLLKDRYPQFQPEYTPKAMEVVANRFREKDDPDGFYQRLLTQCWREAYRILKPGGLLAFTFHHSEDDPWIAVLESLFDAGFYLVATYPIRGDETKGDKAQFGSQKVEYC